MSARSRRNRNRIVFAVVAATTALSLFAAAQPKKGGAAKPTPGAAPAPAKKPPAGKGTKPDEADGGTITPKDERATPAASAKDAGTGANGVVEQKSTDGGSHVFRFGEVEVEARLKSPQIVYFLRRVRAEFAAGDLGHRTFMRELSETRNESPF